MNAADKRPDPCKTHSWGLATILPNNKGTLRLCRFCQYGQHRPAGYALRGFRTITPEEVKRYAVK